jgi:MFS family permease
MRLLGIAAVFHFTVYLSSPYFGPFMLETLHFTYIEYMSASIWVVVCKAVSTLWWGRAVDRFGARPIFLIAVILVGIVPLPWLVANGLWVVWLAQALSGASWSAYELGFFTLVLESTTARTRPTIFAAQSLMAGWSQLAGSAVAAALLPGLGGRYVALFALSAVCRLLVGLFIPFVLRPAVPLEPVRSRWLALRALGFRPGAGLSRRPVFDPTDVPADRGSGGGTPE